MRFYIYKYISNSWTWVEVNVEIEPNLTRAWDTTNDTFKCVLGVNEDAEPYKPMTAFKIVDDNGQETIMWIINDTVTIYSLSPLCYKHELSLVQYRYFLNKHLVRNTVFNQPKINKQKTYTAVNLKYIYYGTEYYYVVNYDMNYQPIAWQDKTILNPHSKIKNLVLEYCFYYVRDTGEVDGDGNPVEVSLTKLTTDVFSAMNSTPRTNTYIKLCDANNSDYVIYTIRVFDYERNSQVPLPKAAVDAVNNYIASRGNNPVQLYGKYDAALDSGETEVNPIITRSFLKTNDTSLQDEVDTDIFKPIVLQVNLYFDMYNYTMYDVLDILLKQYRLTDYYGVHKRDLLFNLPQSGDLYDLLTNTYPPDTLSFTQATFYDALTEIFRFYDAGFKFDENKTLQIEYYNNPQEERNDVAFSGKSMSFSERNLSNGRVAYYQNSIQRIDIPFTKTRTDTVGTPEKTSFCIITPKPIYNIYKLTMQINGTNVVLCGSKSIKNLSMDLDLTPFVVNRSVWSVLDTISNPLTDASDYQKLYKQDTIPFDRGSNTINISTYSKDWAGTENAVLGFVIDIAMLRFFGQPVFQMSILYTSFQSLAQVWHSHKFSISYDSIVNGRLETKTLNDQYEGEMLVNQGNGMVDISKLGLNILGESLKDGQPTLTASCELTDWDNKINEGDYIIYQGSRWVANVVNYKPIKPGVYSVTVEFSKNFNALSLRVKTDREKRLTAISGEQAVISEDSYVDYVYVSDGTMMPSRETTIFDNNILESLVGQTFGIPADGYSVKNIDVACVITYGENGEINKFGNLGWQAENIVIPLIKYGAGNCLCFEVQYDSPIGAGNSLGYQKVGLNDVYTSYNILYTDDEGWADLITIRYLQNSDITYGDFPVITSATGVAIIDKLKYYKKPNEIFGLNYELCFLPILSQVDNFFIGNAFIKNNFFVSAQKTEKKFYLYYDNNYKYSILDAKGHGSNTPITFSTISNTNVVFLRILTSSTITAKSWSICDENGDIYFASNNTKVFTSKSSTTESIVFTTRRTKMTEQDSLTAVPTISSPLSCTFTVAPYEWVQYFPVQTMQVGATVSSVSIWDEHNKLAYGTGSYQNLILIGQTLAFVDITKAPSGFTNTVSFDSATGTFSWSVYDIGDYAIGDRIPLTITYRVSGAPSVIASSFSKIVPELVSQDLTNISITPASEVLHYPNEISFDSATGTFKGMVYSSVMPIVAITYTITYTIT